MAAVTSCENTLYYTYGSSDETTAQIRPPRINTDFQISYISPEKKNPTHCEFEYFMSLSCYYLGKIIIRNVRKPASLA